MRYRVNSPDVVAEAFEDEVVVVNFDDGSYFTLADTARELWLAIAAGAGDDEVVEALASAYVADRAELSTAVATFLERLLEARLIVPDPDVEAGLDGPLAGNGAGERGPFRAPEITLYTDMQELLMLDPIHEVDEGGWPQRRPQ
jgi:hypothetical protein